MKVMPYTGQEWFIECVGCLGTGKYDPRTNSQHKKCKGTGRLERREMTTAQYWMIKRLFNELVELKVIVKNDGLWNHVTDLMNKHRDAVAIENTDNMLSTHSASDIIEMLKDHKSRAFKRNR